MYADDLYEINSTKSVNEGGLEVIWHRDCLRLVQKILEFEKTYQQPNCIFSRVLLAEVKRYEKSRPRYYTKKSFNEEEWLSGQFIKTLHLEGTDRYFGVYSIGKGNDGCLNVRKNKTKINHWFFLQNTINGYKMVLFDKREYDKDRIVALNSTFQ